MRARARYRGVLIDLWGTLVPTSPATAVIKHLHSVADALGADPISFTRDWEESMAERCRGELGSLEESIRWVAARQAFTPTERAVRRAADIRVAFHRSALQASAPLLPALDALRDSGMRLVLVSDATSETPRAWSSVPMGSRFAGTVFSCETGFCKPDPRVYVRALELIGLPPGDCAFVGDGGSRELTGAQSAGLEAFLYRFPGQPRAPDHRYLPDTEWNGPILGDLRELLAVELKNPRGG
jgi:putative hydrolase of the HAD superfamily